MHPTIYEIPLHDPKQHQHIVLPRHGHYYYHIIFMPYFFLYIFYHGESSQMVWNLRSYCGFVLD